MLLQIPIVLFRCLIVHLVRQIHSLGESWWSIHKPDPLPLPVVCSEAWFLVDVGHRLAVPVSDFALAVLLGLASCWCLGIRGARSWNPCRGSSGNRVCVLISERKPLLVTPESIVVKAKRRDRAVCIMNTVLTGLTEWVRYSFGWLPKGARGLGSCGLAKWVWRCR